MSTLKHLFFYKIKILCRLISPLGFYTLVLMQRALECIKSCKSLNKFGRSLTAQVPHTKIYAGYEVERQIINHSDFIYFFKSQTFFLA